MYNILHPLLLNIRPDSPNTTFYTFFATQQYAELFSIGCTGQSEVATFILTSPAAEKINERSLLFNPDSRVHGEFAPPLPLPSPMIPINFLVNSQFWNFLMKPRPELGSVGWVKYFGNSLIRLSKDKFPGLGVGGKQWRKCDENREEIDLQRLPFICRSLPFAIVHLFHLPIRK